MSLTDLFSNNSPTRSTRVPSPPLSPSATPGPSRRRGGEALFLDGASTPYQTPLKRRYAAFDDDDEPPLSPSWDDDLDLDTGMDRAANNRHPDTLDDVDVGGIEPRALAELFDDPRTTQDPLALGGSTEAGAEPKAKRITAKIDAERLLAPKGFPALMKAAKKFKPKGKGHEASDLTKLMDTYQMWAHSMFPKGEFAYTVERIEKTCRTDRMRSAIKGFRDDFHPPPRSPSPPLDFPEDDEDADAVIGHGGGGGQESLGAFIERDEESMGDETFRYNPGAETLAADRRAPRPLFDDGPDMPDEEELAAMEEMERESAPQQESTAKETMAPKRVIFGDEAPDFDEEEEW